MVISAVVTSAPPVTRPFVSNDILVLVAEVIGVFGERTLVPITRPKLDLAASAVVAPVPPFAMLMVVPLQVPEVITPTLVKLEPVMLLCNAVPVKVPASIDKLIFSEDVSRPFSSTVNTGIVDEDPYVPAVIPVFGSVLVESTYSLTALTVGYFITEFESFVMLFDLFAFVW